MPDHVPELLLLQAVERLPLLCCLKDCEANLYLKLKV